MNSPLNKPARRRPRAAVVELTALALAAAALSGCVSVSRADPRPTKSQAVATAPHPGVTAPGRLGSTTTSTTTSPPPPPLPLPTPIAPLVSPPLPGEGAWQPAGDKLANGYAMYTTELRPAAGLPAAGVAWVDSAATRVTLYAGTSEPSGTWPQQGAVAAVQQPALMAAFNSGFKIYAYHTGWYDQGATAVPLQAGAASLVILADGTATIAAWGRDVSSGPTVTAVRQNLTLLVDHGVATPQVSSPRQWGAVLGGGVSTWRSGIGVTAAGDLVYVAGPGLRPSSLAGLLVAAGAVRAMELDINPQWVSFTSFTHPGGIGTGGAAGTNLLNGMHESPSHYLQPYSRDFFTVSAR